MEVVKQDDDCFRLAQSARTEIQLSLPHRGGQNMGEPRIHTRSFVGFAQTRRGSWTRANLGFGRFAGVAA